MTDLASRPLGSSLAWQAIMTLGRVAAYAAVPLSLASGPVLPAPQILVPVYLIAAIGFVAILRGTRVPPLLMTVAYVCFGWYAVLLAIDMMHGGPLQFPLTYQANLLASNFVLLAFPFLIVGLRECRVEMRHLEWAIKASLLVIACVTVYQFVVEGVPRPKGFSTNPIPFGLMCTIWGSCLLARAFGRPAMGWMRLGFALVALVPIALAGSKIVWLSALFAYGGLFFAWVLRGARWRALLAVAIGLIPIVWLLSQAAFVRDRFFQLGTDLTGFLAGDLSGATFGIRFGAALGGLRAFLDRPLFGYGMVQAKLAATEHQLPGESSFGRLYHLHNEYVTYMVAFGFLGLLFVLMFLWAFLFAARRNADPGLNAWGVALAACLAIYMSGEVISEHSFLQGICFFVLGLLFAAADVARPGEHPASRPAVATGRA